MALQIQCEQTSSFGENEGDDSGMGFEEWLRSRKISEETTTALIKNGIDSKYILAQCEAGDIDELSQNMQHNMQFKEKIILKGLIAELSALKISNKTSKTDKDSKYKPEIEHKSESQIEIKRIAVGYEEEKALIKMENKLKEIEDKISINDKTNENTLKTKEECNKEIEITFDEIYKALNERKQCLLDTVESLTIKQQNVLNEKKKSLENKQERMKEILSDCDDLLNKNTNISMRKEKILELANNNIFDDNKEDDGDDEKNEIEQNDNDGLTKIYIDFKKATEVIEIINKCGNISMDPIPMILNLTNNKKNFMVNIEWRLSANNDNKNDIENEEEQKKEDEKLKVEWCLNKDDEKLEWNEQKFDLSMDAMIDVINNGIYLFRIAYFNGFRWSMSSNWKEIIIADVRLIDKWDEKCKSKSLTIDGSSIIHSDTKSTRCSAYLSNIINDGCHRWKFLIEKFEKVSGWRQEIGVYYNNNNNNHEMIYDGYFTSKENNCYAFRFDGSLANPYKKYGIEWNEGDEIDMFLDLNEQTLSYSINNQYLGKAFDVKKGANINYRGAVDIYRRGNKIKLLSYDHEKHPEFIPENDENNEHHDQQDNDEHDEQNNEQ